MALLLETGMTPEVFLTSTEGKEVKLKTTKFFIPTIWNVEISLIKKPYMIVDTGITSPFKFWRHSHKFSKKGEFCELKDEIEYELPLGFLGDLFNPLIKKELEKMFKYRQEKTKMILEKRND